MFISTTRTAFLLVETHHDLRHTIKRNIERVETCETIVRRELEEDEFYRFADSHEDTRLDDNQDNRSISNLGGLE